MIGPYHEPTVKLEVEVMEPEFSVTREVIEGMRNAGIKVRDKESREKEREGENGIQCMEKKCM